jgi:hypothetical protein
MPNTISWCIPERVIHVCVSGIVTLEEIIESDQEGREVFKQGKTPIHIIVEHHNVEKLPTNIRHMRQAMSNLNAPEIGWVILVSDRRSLWSYVGQVVAQMAMIRWRQMETRDEALHFLRQQDPSLPPF